MIRKKNKRGVNLKIIVLAVVLLLLLVTILVGVIGKRILPGFDMFKVLVSDNSKKCKETGVSLKEYQEAYREKIDRKVVIFETDKAFFDEFYGCFPTEFKEIQFGNDHLKYNHGRILSNLDPKYAQEYLEDVVEQTQDPSYKRLNTLELIEIMKKQKEYDSAVQEIEKNIQKEKELGEKSNKAFVSALYLLKASILTSEGKKEEAIQIYKGVFDTFEKENIIAYERGLEELAKLYMKNKEYEEMMETYLMLIDYKFERQMPGAMMLLYNDAMEKFTLIADEQETTKERYEVYKIMGKLTIHIMFDYGSDIDPGDEICIKESELKSAKPAVGWSAEDKNNFNDYRAMYFCPNYEKYRNYINI